MAVNTSMAAQQALSDALSTMQQNAQISQKAAQQSEQSANAANSSGGGAMNMLTNPALLQLVAGAGKTAAPTESITPVDAATKSALQSQGLDNGFNVGTANIDKLGTGSITDAGSSSWLDNLKSYLFGGGQ